MKSINPRTIVFAVVGGGAVILLAPYLLAKPETKVAQPIAQPPSGVNVSSRALRGAVRPGAAARDRGTIGGHGDVRLAKNDAEAPATSSPIVPEPPLRELFRPLVVKEAPKTAATAPVKAPVLPNAGKTTAITKPAPTPEQPTTPPTPPGPNISEIQMLGVVDGTDGPKALLKKTTTGESRFFGQGEDAYGFKVETVQATEVSLSRDGQTRRVEMSHDQTIETTTGQSMAARSSFSGGPGRFSTGFQRDRSNGGGYRNDRGSRGDGGTSVASDPTASVMSLATWTERLKKLEEVKAQIDPAKYQRLKDFMTKKAADEKGK